MMQHDSDGHPSTTACLRCHMCKCACSLQALFEEAIQQSLQLGLGAGRLWYPYSYCIAMLARRACFFVAQTSLLGAHMLAASRDTPATPQAA